MKAICEDLREEYNALDQMVSNLDEEGWNKETPFYGWTIKDEIQHISFFDTTGMVAATDRERFMKDFETLLLEMKPGDDIFDVVNKLAETVPPADLLSGWRKNRNLLVDALENLDPRDRLPWYGPDMSAKSFATARLMETWAHSQDIADTLKIKRRPTDRLKHIAHIGVTTFKWSFINRQEEVPEGALRIALESPSGDLWEWGPEGAENSVKGSAEDFCFVVTQRRSVKDTLLDVQGEGANKWMELAQAFAGPAEMGPKPGERVV